MTNRIKPDMHILVNNLNSRYHGRKGRVLRYMGKVDAYDKDADCWEVRLGTACNFMVFRQNELAEWSSDDEEDVVDSSHYTSVEGGGCIDA